MPKVSLKEAPYCCSKKVLKKQSVYSAVPAGLNVMSSIEISPKSTAAAVATDEKTKNKDANRLVKIFISIMVLVILLTKIFKKLQNAKKNILCGKMKNAQNRISTGSAREGLVRTLFLRKRSRCP